MKFKAYHKIKQFKEIVRSIQTKSDFKGLDTEGSPIYKQSKKPILKFNGTVKLHGTNALVSYTPKEGIVAGKRSSNLSLDQLTAHMGLQVKKLKILG